MRRNGIGAHVETFILLSTIGTHPYPRSPYDWDGTSAVFANADLALCMEYGPEHTRKTYPALRLLQESNESFLPFRLFEHSRREWLHSVEKKSPVATLQRLRVHAHDVTCSATLGEEDKVMSGCLVCECRCRQSDVQCLFGVSGNRGEMHEGARDGNML